MPVCQSNYPLRAQPEGNPHPGKGGAFPHITAAEPRRVACPLLQVIFYTFLIAVSRWVRPIFESVPRLVGSAVPATLSVAKISLPIARGTDAIIPSNDRIQLKFAIYAFHLASVQGRSPPHAVRAPSH